MLCIPFIAQWFPLFSQSLFPFSIPCPPLTCLLFFSRWCPAHSSPLRLYTFALPRSFLLWQHSHFCPTVILSAFPPCFQSNKWQLGTCVCGCVCMYRRCVCAWTARMQGEPGKKKRSGTTEEQKSGIMQMSPPSDNGLQWDRSQLREAVWNEFRESL